MKHIEDFKDIQVFINCGGKSGSKTLEKTLSNHYKCLHTHGNFYFQKNITFNDSYTLYDCIEQSMEVFDDVYVIDSYRTPIERAISSSFQNNSETILDNFNYNLLIGENYNCLDECMKYFKLPFIEDFNFEKKCKQLQYKNLHFVKIKFSDIKEWGNILSDIFGKKISMVPDNLSQNKQYYDNYISFLENFKIPKIYFDYLTNHKDFKIYNSLIEQQNYINKWKDKIDYDYVLRIKNLPEDFNWQVYVKLNNEEGMNELEACIHYAQTGYLENKKYK